MTTNLQFALSPTPIQGLPTTGGTVPALLQQALQGASGTAAFFSAQNQLAGLITWINEQGDSAWIESTDANGNPVFFAEQTGAGTASQSVIVSSAFANVIDPTSMAADDDTGQTGFTWQGQDYQVVGSINLTTSWNNNTQRVVTIPVGVLTAIGASGLAGYAWAGLVKPLLQGVVAGIKSCFSAAPEVATAADAAEAAGDAADAAGVDAAAVGEASVSMAVGAAAFAGMIVLAAVPFIIGALEHPTSQALKVYNLTPYTLTWSLPYIDDGTMNVCPGTGGTDNTTNPNIPGLMSMSPGNGITPVEVYSEGDFAFQNTNNLKGFSYVMTFTLTDETQQPAQILGTAAVMFDLPWGKDNSLYAEFGTPGHVENWAQKHYDQIQQTFYQVTSTLTNGDAIQLAVTYDYLDGQHASPSNPSQQGYIYNSLAVFSIA
jgi:hypothetical protein